MLLGAQHHEGLCIFVQQVYRSLVLRIHMAIASSFLSKIHCRQGSLPSGSNSILQNQYPHPGLRLSLSCSIFILILGRFSHAHAAF